jgi:hypothetical protein
VSYGSKFIELNYAIKSKQLSSLTTERLMQELLRTLTCLAIKKIHFLHPDRVEVPGGILKGEVQKWLCFFGILLRKFYLQLIFMGTS